MAACPDGTPVTVDFVIGSYHELWNIEKSFRMSKSDLQAGPSTTANATPSRRTSPSCSQPLPSAAGSRQNRLVHQEIRQDRLPLPHHPGGAPRRADALSTLKAQRWVVASPGDPGEPAPLLPDTKT